MAKITFIEFNGNEHQVEASPGTSVMQAAVDNSIRGIVADCGGACSCATCHVYVEPEWADRVGDKSDMEAVMLEEVFDPQPTSRLSCQIEISDSLDGLVVRIPERQF